MLPFDQPLKRNLMKQEQMYNRFENALNMYETGHLIQFTILKSVWNVSNIKSKIWHTII